MIFGLKNEKMSREIVKGDKAISVLNPAASLRFMQFEKKVLTISSSLQIYEAQQNKQAVLKMR